jgi:hypothetical protein
MSYSKMIAEVIKLLNASRRNMMNFDIFKKDGQPSTHIHSLLDTYSPK